MLRQGGCACGAVRYEVHGEPERVGLCHCMTCRKRHGAPFNAFAVFRAERVMVGGEIAVWASSEHGRRHGCAACGSPILWTDDLGSEVELHLGGLDQPSRFEPQYEIWTSRRESWLRPLDVPQYEQNGGGG